MNWLVRYRAFMTTVGSSFAVVGLQLMQGILLARFLGPVGRGEYATAVLYPQMILLVASLGGIEALGRRAARRPGKTAKLRIAAFRFGLIVGLLTLVIVAFLDLVALPSSKRYLLALCLVAAVAVVGQQIHQMLLAVDRGAGQFARYNWLRLLPAAILPASLLVLVLLDKLTVWGACLAFLISGTGSAVMAMWGKPLPWRRQSHPSMRRLFREGRPYAALMFVNDLFERFDLVLVLWLTPLEVQGYYAAMLPAVYPLTIAPQTLGIFLFNRAAQSKPSLHRAQIIKLLLGAIGLQCLSLVVFAVCIGPLIRFVYGDEYDPAIIFALWLGPVSAAKGICQALDGLLKGLGRPLTCVNARLAAFFVMLATVAILFGTLGAIAIPLSALAGQVVCSAWLGITSIRALQHASKA